MKLWVWRRNSGEDNCAWLIYLTTRLRNNKQRQRREKKKKSKLCRLMKYTTRLLVTSRTSERRRRMKTFETCIFQQAESCRPSCYCRRPTSVRILHATEVATTRCRFWLRRGKPALAESQRKRWIKQHTRLLGEEEILICPAQSLLFSFPIFFGRGVVVVCHRCCQGGSSSQAPCLLLPVFVFNGRATGEGFIQLIKKPF